MDHLFLCIIVAIVMVALMLWRVQRACRANAVIAQWAPVLVASALLWGVIFVIRVHFLAEVSGARADSIFHEYRAHEIAQLIRVGDLQGALSQGGIGNFGFEFVVGVIYAFTNAPAEVVMGFFTLMAFSGLLTLLDVLVRSTQAVHIPFWLVAIVCLYPEGIFFSSDTLKEGPVLWGACTMLRLVVPDPTKKGLRRWLVPWIGAGVFMFLRPHFAFIWLVAIGAAQVIKQKRWGVALLTVGGICISGLLIMALAPNQVNALLHGSLLESLEGSTRMSSGDIGGSQIIYDVGAPIPEVTGLSLLFLRPFPWEAPHWVAFLAGAEAWFLTTLMIISWLNLRHWSRYMFCPLMLTAILATIAMAFIFSYIPNLGLVVRQRMQFFPAMIVLAATPGLIRRSPLYQPQQRLGTPLAMQPAMAGAPVRIRPATSPLYGSPVARRLPVPRRSIPPTKFSQR
ncbi:MAG TPA: hypothetical protein VMJ32_17160 [Pirellulales bacterium]|nr:hypothetical protein [Pirellulales bacterium]